LNSFAIRFCAQQTRTVNLPLALLFYEDLMPGTQLVNRLQDLKYRVQVVATAEELLATAASAGPMLILCDLASQRMAVSEVIKQLRATPATAHLPIIAFADEAEGPLSAAGKAAGATLVVTDAAIIAHLNLLVERALQVE
jgi:CheY-like chemotaxis protein